MKEIIRAGLAELGLLDQVPPEAPEQLAEYGRLMLEKNQVMNLTAITDPEQAARLHMLDSAALLLCADFQGEKTLIDVGTGAGLPGLPLKILVPSLQVTLLDSLGKRVDWLNQVCAQLGLEVARLKRVAVGSLRLGMLQPGQYRELTKEEVRSLTAAAAKAGRQSRGEAERQAAQARKGGAGRADYPSHGRPAAGKRAAGGYPGKGRR